MYTNEKRAYLGFIPNDQTAFVDRLRKVIQQQKSTQMMRQTQGGAGPSMNPQVSYKSILPDMNVDRCAKDKATVDLVVINGKFSNF